MATLHTLHPIRLLFYTTIAVMLLGLVFSSGLEYGRAQRQQTIELRATELLDSTPSLNQQHIEIILFGEIQE